MSVGNKGVFVGRFTEDPKLESSSTGTFYCKFTLARNDGFGDNQKTIYVPFTAFGKKAEFITKYFQKGKMIIVGYNVGMTKKYEKDGQTFWPHPCLYVSETEFAGDGSRSEFNGGTDDSNNNESEPFDDDIPF